MTETPKQAARRLAAGAIRDGFKPQALHAYTDPEGKPLHWRIRLKHPDSGDKWIRPMKLNGAGYALGEPEYPDGKPLYRLHVLSQRTDEPVFVCEGENKVDALEKLGILATTSGGATSADGVDWSPIAGREVRIWPDNDEAGNKYAHAVAEQLLHLGCRVTIIDVSQLGLAEKGDAVDWVGTHPKATQDDVMALAVIASKVRPDVRKEATPTSKPSTQSAAKKLVAIGEEAELFHDERREGYAVVKQDGTHMTLRLRGEEFKSWLSRQCWMRHRAAAGSDTINTALTVLESKARFEGRCMPLSNRFAYRDGAIYIDLVDERWRVVKVTADGWEVLNTPGLFRRFSHQRSLPVPERGGSLDELSAYLNVTDEDRMLLFAWLVTAPLAHVPRPIIAFYGAQGSGKSTAGRVLRGLLDPSALDNLSFPKRTDELAQILDHHAVPNFDNLRSVDSASEDMLCRAVTGGGFSKRELFTDAEDVILNFKRAVILNGINIPTHAPDLLDRMMLIELERITEGKRRTEDEFYRDFNAAHPRLFGALLDAMVLMLRQPPLGSGRLPRMADFTAWAMRWADGGGRGADVFLDTYRRNIGRQTDEAIEADELAVAIRALVEPGKWEGTPADLLVALNTQRGMAPAPDNWPKKANVLSRRLRVLQATLGQVGIRVDLRAFGQPQGHHSAANFSRAGRRSPEP